MVPSNLKVTLFFWASASLWYFSIIVYHVIAAASQKLRHSLSLGISCRSLFLSKATWHNHFFVTRFPPPPLLSLSFWLCLIKLSCVSRQLCLAFGQLAMQKSSHSLPPMSLSRHLAPGIETPSFYGRPRFISTSFGM
jgi:hypothetical protein